MQFLTPLRYPGGKGRLAQFVADLICDNDLHGGHYVEPYAGGAAVAITLLSLEYVRFAHINDLNRSVHAFWRAVLNDTDALCSMIARRRVTMASWHRQRAVQADPNADPLELAYSTFFLNRTNRSGIISGGVIGGREQSGHWRLDARYNKGDLIQRIEAIARLRHRIHLYNLDAATLLRKVLPDVPRRSLVYLDPPYYVTGKGLYEDHYQHQDHLDVANTMSSIVQPWIVSYDNVPEIRQLYRGYAMRTFGLRYSAQKRYEGAEVMFFSPRIKAPRVVTASRAAAA